MEEKEHKKEGLLNYFFAFLTGQMIQQINLKKTVPLLIYVVALALITIGNTYYGQKQVSTIETLQKDIKQLKFKHTITKSSLMELTKQSTLEKNLSDRGLRITKEPPRKITTNQDR